MKCHVCKRDVPEFNAILLNADGDFVCSGKCKRRYEKDRDEFFDSISDDAKYDKWMEG